MNRIIITESGGNMEICVFCDSNPATHEFRCLYRPELLALLPICGACESRLYDLLDLLLLHGQEALFEVQDREE